MPEILQTIIESNAFEIIIKIILITILAGAVGIERASLNKPAGFRTHVLLGISAVLTVQCGKYLFEQYGSDITRIPAQLLSGIGFLGAGTILRDGFSVKGLTTAASLLAITCIGLCVGAGLYLCAIIATLMVYLILSYSGKWSDKITHYNDLNLSVETTNSKNAMEHIQFLLEKNQIEIKNIAIENGKDQLEVLKIEGKYKDEINKNALLTDLMNVDDVTRVLEV